MCFIRDKWLAEEPVNVPMPPKVLAWNARYDNPAGTPYIILEYAHGGDDVAAALDDIRALETSSLHLPFVQHGAIYFADDVPDSDELRNRPLFPTGDHHASVLDKSFLELSKKYRIGPTTSREWWRGAYGRVDADRGPWPDMKSMIESATRLQLRALDTVIDLSSPSLKSQPSDGPLLRRLLETCIRVAPFIIPTDPAFTQPVLAHPDLSLTNLITSPEGPANIRSVIDWQGTTVSPFVIQCALPQAVVYSGGLIPLDQLLVSWPDNFDEMTPAEQTIISYHHRLASRHKLYVYETRIKNKPRFYTWRLPHFEALTNMVTYITRCIADGPGDLHGCLVDLQSAWDTEISEAPCPLNFTEEEIQSVAAERAGIREYGRHVENLYMEIHCRDDGSVDPGHYEAAKALMERRREEWDEVAMKGPFPFYEGAHSYHLT
ncbi:hypothetical protein C8Q78DRAFT_1082111 [Trametes maxima]|nr:hypothetical protein C8Q78DRAFT_1082111 [Trametes maxima]